MELVVGVFVDVNAAYFRIVAIGVVGSKAQDEVEAVGRSGRIYDELVAGRALAN